MPIPVSGRTGAPILAFALAAVVAAAQTGPRLPRTPPAPPAPSVGGSIPTPQTQNYDVKALERGCDDGNLRDCEILAGLLASGRGVERDRARSRELYERACQGGLASSCEQLARSLMPEDWDRARALFEQACDGGAGWSCLEAGMMRNRIKDGAQDLKGAAEYYAKACDAGLPTGCMFGGDAYRTGKGVARGPSRGLALLERGCELGDPMSCLAAAVMYERGEAGTIDLARAAELRARGPRLKPPEPTPAIDVDPPPANASGSAEAGDLTDAWQDEGAVAEPSPVEPPSQSVDQLLTQLRKGTLEARIAAASELARAGSVGPEGVAALRRALASRDERLREAAAWALASLDDPEAKNALKGFYDAPAKPIKMARPEYPQSAFLRKIDGTVMIRGLIASDGRVIRTAVIESVPALDKAALACVRQWQFRPATRRGRPVPSTAAMPVTFRIY
jgi:TonB family protein